MSEVIIEQPGVTPITLPLSRPVTHMGRAEDNDVVLVADEVSRHHVKLVIRGGQHILYDLNSLNGTYVNRQRVVERVLSDKDEIWLGSKCRLLFRAGAAPVPKAADGRDSALMQDLNKIREEMEDVGNSLTMIGKRAKTPVPAGLHGVSEADVLKMSRAFRRLDALYKASRLIASDFDLHKRLSAVLDTAIDVMGAQRGFIMLCDETDGSIRVSVAREMGQELHASSPSMGIAGRAAIDGEPVLMADRNGHRECAVVRTHGGR